MSEINEMLAALGQADVTRLERHDPGHLQIQAALQREIDRQGRGRRRIRLPFARGGVALLPAGLLAASAVTAAAATIALVSASPRRLFEHNPQRGFSSQAVVPSTVVRVATVRIPGYGPVQYWAAETKQGGGCWGLRDSSGEWLTLDHKFNNDDGSIPGCGPTRKQQVLAQGNSPVGLAPTAVDELSNSIKLSNGRWWDIYYGTVDANGAVAVKDPTTGKTAPILQDRFILAEPNPNPHCLACDQLRATNSNGKALLPNYGPKRFREH